MCAVLLIETHALLRRHITGFLHDIDGSAMTITGIGLLDELEPLQLAAMRPDIVLLGTTNSIALVRQAISQVHGCFPSTALIVLGLLDGEHYRQAILEAGADAFLAKDALITTLPLTIHHAINTAETRQL